MKILKIISLPPKGSKKFKKHFLNYLKNHWVHTTYSAFHSEILGNVDCILISRKYAPEVYAVLILNEKLNDDPKFKEFLNSFKKYEYIKII